MGEPPGGPSSADFLPPKRGAGPRRSIRAQSNRPAPAHSSIFSPAPPTPSYTQRPGCLMLDLGWVVLHYWRCFLLLPPPSPHHSNVGAINTDEPRGGSQAAEEPPAPAPPAPGAAATWSSTVRRIPGMEAGEQQTARRGGVIFSKLNASTFSRKERGRREGSPAPLLTPGLQGDPAHREHREPAPCCPGGLGCPWPCCCPEAAGATGVSVTSNSHSKLIGYQLLQTKRNR